MKNFESPDRAQLLERAICQFRESLAALEIDKYDEVCLVVSPRSLTALRYAARPDQVQYRSHNSDGPHRMRVCGLLVNTSRDPSKAS